MSLFTIDTDHLHWLDDSDEDICLHGHAVALIGNERFEYDAAVSATGLYLLKSLTEDHVIHEDNQMLPCCGHFLLPDGDNVCILGCTNGIDWSVLHDDNRICIVTESGQRVKLSLDAYVKEVVRFADRIEAFYSSAKPRKLPEDLFERDAYSIFWKEWRRRRQEADIMR